MMHSLRSASPVSQFFDKSKLAYTQFHVTMLFSLLDLNPPLMGFLDQNQVCAPSITEDELVSRVRVMIDRD